MVEDRRGTINDTAASVLEGKNTSKTITSCATLETHEEMPILIPVKITEDAVGSVAQMFLGNSGPGGTDSEELQGWLLKFGEDSTRLRTSVETFVDCLSNESLPWAAYHAFMSGWLIALDKKPGIRPVGVGETRQRLFSKIVLKVTGPGETMACQDDQLCAGLKAGIYGAIHRVQALWEENPSTEEYFFNS